MSNNMQSRREFCLQARQAASLAVLGGALSALLESCGSSNPLDAGGGNIANSQLIITVS